MPLPALTESGDLPVRVHRATLHEALTFVGVQTVRRRVVALRLQRIYQLAAATGHLARFVVFGSFVTSKPEPNDVDVFMLMSDSFDVREITGEARLLFEHETARVFWLRRVAAFGGEQSTIEDWQVKRDGRRRGIVEIIGEGP